MLRLAKMAFWLLIFSLPFAKPIASVGGLAVTATDVLFVIAAGAFATALVTGDASLRWNAFYGILLIYFAAMLVSALGSGDPERSAIKLASQAYLIALPVLARSLIDAPADLRTALKYWLAATAIVAAVGTLALLFFVLGVGGPALEFALHPFGTLPPGDYPRLDATFASPAMLCNYLTVSLLILLVARRSGWVGPAAFHLLLAAAGVTALFTLTPGLGGFLLAIALWMYLVLESRRYASAAMAAGAAVALVFVLAAALTPIVHPTAPFLIQLPGIDQPLAPSVRMMTWLDAWHRFLDNPLIGSGIGSDAVAVRYVDPSGFLHVLTDAHNVFLNFAVQCGLIGLAAMILLVVKVAQLTGPLRLGDRNVLRLGLGLAWLDAFAYQGLTGSYEDARHLWVLLGLMLTAIRLEALE